MPKATVLSDVLYRIKQESPELFKAFLKEFTLHTDKVTAAVTDADASEIMTAKGYAQHARWFLRQLVECHLPHTPNK
jgi:hypothetical protein